MKKTVLTFGLISGALLSLMMLATVPFMDRIGFDNGMVLGYTTMVLSFMLVFFGIRSYRDNLAGGSISFGKAFVVGILITVVASICYVGTWEVVYFKFMPDFAVEVFEICYRQSNRLRCHHRRNQCEGARDERVHPDV